MRFTKVFLLPLFLLSFFAWKGMAQPTSGNPIIKHLRTADPSAKIWDDGKVWIYASHDPNDATDYSTMDGYHVFSSYDMINWTDHGEVLHSRDVDWGLEQGGFMFAPDAAYKNGTYYFYYPHPEKGWKGWRVGVATSDRPEGPFTDQGFIEGTDEIDPMCFIDDDGQAYLTWCGGYNGPWIARLKENMVELAEEPRLIDYGSDNCGEGPFIHKRNGIYYFSYTDHAGGAHAEYSMGDNVYGPYEHKGKLKSAPPGAQDHHSMVEYHGQWYYFYHRGDYGPNASMFRRNTCVDSMFYREDGSIELVVGTDIGVGQDRIGATAGHLVPGAFEAEDFYSQVGISIRQVDAGNSVLTDIQSGDSFDFVLEVLGDETYRLDIKVLAPVAGTEIFLLVDEGVKDTLELDGSTENIQCDLFLHHGKHVLELAFSHTDPGADLLEVDRLEFSGDIIYHRITTSATEGGSIWPEGEVYVADGEDKRFVFDPATGYQLDSILVDGQKQVLALEYTMIDVRGDHILAVYFSPCEGAALIPYTRVNTDAWIQQSSVTVGEGEDLALTVEFEGIGELTWYHPGGLSIGVDTMYLDQISTGKEGNYRVEFINEVGCESTVLIHVVVIPVVLDVFQAEDWKDMSGVQTESCTDLGGGEHVAFIENNDWCTYSIEVEKDGVYDFTVRASTASYGGYVELSLGDEVLGLLLISDDLSNGWQDWYTSESLELELAAGTHELKLTFKGSAGYLFNLNWFDLEFNRDIVALDKAEAKTSSLHCYYPQGGPGIEISYSLNRDSLVSMEVINLSGRHTRTLVDAGIQSPGTYHMSWQGDNDRGAMVNPGMYFLLFSADDYREVQKLILH